MNDLDIKTHLPSWTSENIRRALVVSNGFHQKHLDRLAKICQWIFDKVILKRLTYRLGLTRLMDDYVQDIRKQYEAAIKTFPDFKRIEHVKKLMKFSWCVQHKYRYLNRKYTPDAFFEKFSIVYPVALSLTSKQYTKRRKAMERVKAARDAVQRRVEAWDQSEIVRNPALFASNEHEFWTFLLPMSSKVKAIHLAKVMFQIDQLDILAYEILPVPDAETGVFFRLSGQHSGVYKVNPERQQPLAKTFGTFFDSNSLVESIPKGRISFAFFTYAEHYRFVRQALQKIFPIKEIFQMVLKKWFAPEDLMLLEKIMQFIVPRIDLERDSIVPWNSENTRKSRPRQAIIHG